MQVIYLNWVNETIKSYNLYGLIFTIENCNNCYLLITYMSFINENLNNIK